VIKKRLRTTGLNQLFPNCGTRTASVVRSLQGGRLIGLPSALYKKTVFIIVVFTYRVVLKTSWIFVYFPCWFTL